MARASIYQGPDTFRGSDKDQDEKESIWKTWNLGNFPFLIPAVSLRHLSKELKLFLSVCCFKVHEKKQVSYGDIITSKYADWVAPHC
jgi:hypothetical protein